MLLSSRRQISYPDPDRHDGPPDIPLYIKNLVDKVDGDVPYNHGPAAGRPSPGFRGRIYQSDDTGAIDFDDGTKWVTVGGGFLIGNDAAKPAATANAGRGYFASDTGLVYVSNGVSWIRVPADTTLSLVTRPTSLGVPPNTPSSAPLTAITSDAVVLDGTTRVKIEFFCAQVTSNASDGGSMVVVLYRNNVARTVIEDAPFGASVVNWFVYDLPAADTYTWSVRAFNSSPVSTNTLIAGAGTGGLTDHAPMQLRITAVRT